MVEPEEALGPGMARRLGSAGGQRSHDAPASRRATGGGRAWRESPPPASGEIAVSRTFNGRRSRGRRGQSAACRQILTRHPRRRGSPAGPRRLIRSSRRRRGERSHAGANARWIARRRLAAAASADTIGDALRGAPDHRAARPGHRAGRPAGAGRATGGRGTGRRRCRARWRAARRPERQDRHACPRQRPCPHRLRGLRLLARRQPHARQRR